MNFRNLKMEEKVLFVLSNHPEKLNWSLIAAHVSKPLSVLNPSNALGCKHHFADKASGL